MKRYEIIIIGLAGLLLVSMLTACGGGEQKTTTSACSSTAKAVAAPISITPSGDSAYTVQSSGLDGVAGIQLDIAYDAASLSGTPTVTQGGLVAGAMFVANTTRPGLIKIAIISTKPFSGSGPIAIISFASKTGSGGITSANVSMINSAGAPVPASVSITNASGSGVPDPSSIAGLPFTQPVQTYIDANGQVQSCP